MNAKEARQLILRGSAPIIRDVLRLATGEASEDCPGAYYNVDKEARRFVLETVAPMMQAAGDIQKVTASTSADIIQLLREGTVSVSEATSLMGIVQMQFEMTELKAIGDKLEEATNPNGTHSNSSAA